MESEVEFLEEYSFLIRRPGNKYTANILIFESDEKAFEMQSEMYEKAAELVSNEIFDKLYESEIIKEGSVYYPQGDKNFLMWTLAFYVLAVSETDEVDKITFEDVATIRKDGGQNIPSASIEAPLLPKPKYFEMMDMPE